MVYITDMKTIYTSVPDFERFIKEGCLYVDKTEYLYNMIIGSPMVFFARPR